jgi:hypothetical protein
VEDDSTAQMADTVDGVLELGSQQVADLVHRLSSRWAVDSVRCEGTSKPRAQASSSRMACEQ